MNNSNNSAPNSDTVRSYLSIIVQPPDGDGAREVWGSHVVSCKGLGSFDSDGIIGFLYEVEGYWVYLNQMGHPIRVFPTIGAVNVWLGSRASKVKWPATYLQAEDR